MRKRRGTSTKGLPRGLLSALLGLGTGLLIGLLLFSWSSQSTPPPPTPPPRRRAEAAPRRLGGGGLLYVGVMTARKYLNSRARAVYESWGKEVPGDIGFYSSENSSLEQGGLGGDLPLHPLPRVDDSYPPQKKSFLMLEHMWREHGGYEWYLRADDDLYVRTDRLEALLRSVDTRARHGRGWYVGQAGRGNAEEFGLLSLEYDENFCMGGPGVLVSRETLALVVPHIKYCLSHLYTSHEDVELGRCVRKFAGVSCTWNYEVGIQPTAPNTPPTSPWILF